MTKYYFFILLLLITGNSSAQVTELLIKPSETDSAITNVDVEHLIMYDASAATGKLLVFLPGTNGIPDKGPKDFFKSAVQQGYHVINLSYINIPAVARICKEENLDADPKCAEKFRLKRIYGEGNFDLIEDKPQDAIIHRLTKLLLHLSKIDPERNWDTFIDGDSLKRSETSFSGQSQGGGMSAFIAKRQLVKKVIIFSGGWDFVKKGEIAEWYFAKSVTPLDRWYGTFHKEEPMALTIKETYEAMGIPADQTYGLHLEVQAGRKAHSQAIRNMGYSEIWEQILGSGN